MRTFSHEPAGFSKRGRRQVKWHQDMFWFWGYMFTGVFESKLTSHELPGSAPSKVASKNVGDLGVYVYRGV